MKTATIKYVKTGLGKVEETKISGLEEKSKFDLGNRGIPCEITSITNDSITIIISGVKSRMYPPAKMISDDTYELKLNIDEQVQTGVAIKPSPRYTIELLAVYEEERQFFL